MIVKTKAKITFYPDRFNPKKEFFYGEIRSVEITEFKNILVSGSYFYKEAGENVSIGQFIFNVQRKEAKAYFAKFTSAKTDFMSALEESLYYILLEETAKDLSEKTGILVSDLEIVDNSKNLK
jgi:hypothetical protein